MTDQKGSANDAPDSAAGRQAGNTDKPARPVAGEAKRSPSSRGGRKNAAPKAAASKTTAAKPVGSSEEKSRKGSGGRSAAKAPAAGDLTPQADGADAAPAAAPKRSSRGGAAKAEAKTPSKRSAAAAKKASPAGDAAEMPQESSEAAADKPWAQASSERTGKTGGAGRTGGTARQGGSARGGKSAAASGRSAPAKEAASGDVPTPAEPAVDAPATGRDDPPAAKPASGRTRGSRGGRGRAKASSAPAQSLPAPDGAPVEAAAVALSDVSDAAFAAADAAGLDAGAAHAVLTAEEDRDAEADAAPAEAAASADFAPMDFPTSFGDASPEDFFDAQDDASAEGAGTEKKRRGRSRRNRGRRKSAASAAAVQAGSAAESADDDASVSAGFAEGEDSDDIPELFSYDDDLDDDTSETRESGRKGDRKGGKARAGDEEQGASPAKAPRRKMFVCVLPGEQVEVVITEEGQVQEYYVEMLHQAKTKGNIYKAVIHNVDPNLQAAFVSYGAVKNGFLQIDEIHPEYYVTAHDDSKGRKYPPIQKVIKPGQEVLVQVVKEPAGTKGAFLTTYLSMPGRFLVLTPGREQIGVSRKVENEGERARLRELLEGLSPGPGLGVIVRTVSMGASKTSLQRDLQYLKRTWKDVRTRGTTEKAPCLIYQEEDLTTRAVRDYLTEAVGEVWIDDEATAASIAELAETLFPKKQSLVRAHKDPATSLFERFNLQRQLDQIQSREVSLPSGGRLVIDPTEALTAIDINSGRSGGKSNFEDMAYRTNMEAARMIPLQLRLRDIGGQVVADFIEMRDKSHWREVEKTLRNGMKVDRARYDVGKIGPFGMLEIVRQRLGSSAISISTEPCPCCNGTGVRRNMEWQSQHALRDIHRALRNAQAQNQAEVVYQAEQPLALHLLNNKRQRLLEMEQSFGIHIDIRVKFPEAL